MNGEQPETRADSPEKYQINSAASHLSSIIYPYVYACPCNTSSWKRTMDAFGLPTSFGKPQEPTAGPSSGPSRGGASGRGDRGVVGGGKRNKRGKGRGGDANVGDREAGATSTSATTATTTPSGWDRDRGSANLASQYDAFNGGVKVGPSRYHSREAG